MAKKYVTNFELSNGDIVWVKDAEVDENIGEALDAEIAARNEADNVLRNSIHNEASEREDADDALSARIEQLNGALDNVESDLSDEVSGRINADTLLQNSINTIMASIGTPLVASTIAGMTDHSKIYVYTGSETGYVNGNWYYWNGSAWVSGGVYNSSAVNTDTTLTVSGAPADSKTVGNKAVLANRILISEQTFNTLYGQDYDNLPCNSITCIGTSFPNALHAPFTNFVGNVLTLNYKKESDASEVQLAFSSRNLIYHRVKYVSSGNIVWRDWELLIDSGNVSGYAISPYTTMILTESQLLNLTNNSHSANDFPQNKIICVGTSQDIGLTDHAVINGSPVGTYLTFNYNNTTGDGYAQIFVGNRGMAFRFRLAGSWIPWKTVNYEENVYRVGPTREYTSITALFNALKNDVAEKVIYIDGGVYDIFKEYRDLNIPTPPDDVSAGDYFDYCVFVPANTKVIGLGNVVLRWNPDATVSQNPSYGPITYGEARTWSPLNVKRACEINNIEIRCYKGRYCIHDDSHNNVNDQGVVHKYNNVRCYYFETDNGYGFNTVLGAGFSDKTKYIFENCKFIIDGTTRIAFYGHGSSGSSVDTKNGALIVCNNCIMNTHGDNGRAIRLQNLATAQYRIVSNFCSCYLRGKMVLTNYSNDAMQSFDVTLLKCGTPVVEYDGQTTNIYPVNIYE